MLVPMRCQKLCSDVRQNSHRTQYSEAISAAVAVFDQVLTLFEPYHAVAIACDLLERRRGAAHWQRPRPCSSNACLLRGRIASATAVKMASTAPRRRHAATATSAISATTLRTPEVLSVFIAPERADNCGKLLHFVSPLCVPPKRPAMPEVSQRPYHDERRGRAAPARVFVESGLTALRRDARCARGPLRHTPIATQFVSEPPSCDCRCARARLCGFVSTMRELFACPACSLGQSGTRNRQRP